MEKKFLDESTLTYLRNYIDGQDKVIYKTAANLVSSTHLESLTRPATQPDAQVIPSITPENKQQNLTIGDGLEIKEGALTTKKAPIELYLNITEYITGSGETGSITEEGFNLIREKINRGEVIGISTGETAFKYAYYDEYTAGDSSLKQRLIFIFNNKNVAKLKYVIDEGELTWSLITESILNIPALPEDAATKTYTLQAVNGVLTWGDPIGEINTVLDGINGEVI